MIAITYPLWNDKLYRIYMTPLMDLTGVFLTGYIIMAVLLGTSIRTLAMRNGME